MGQSPPICYEVLTLVFVGSYDRIPLAPPPESCTLFSTLFRCNDQNHWLVPSQANYYVCSCILARSPGVHRIRVPECPADCMHCMQTDRMIQSLVVDSLGGHPRSTKKYTVHVPLCVLMSVLKAGLESHSNLHGAARSYSGAIWPGPHHIPPS